MKLLTFQIKNYKIVDDTDQVNADARVTALVGKNESGKSSILKSLWKSRNVAGAQFDKLFDYPRDRYSRERRHVQQITELRFELAPDERDQVAALLPSSLSEVPKLATYTTSYAGEDGVTNTITFNDGEEHIKAALVARDAIDAFASAVGAANADSDATIRSAADAAMSKIVATEPLWSSGTVAALDSFNAAIAQWVKANQERQPVAPFEKEALLTITSEAKQGDPWGKAREWVKQNLHSFIYFEDYGQLETRIHLPTYLRKKSAPDAKVRTQSALFEWSGIDPQEILDLGRKRADGETDELVQRRHEKRRALLDSASFSLTGDWIGWWTEKRHKLHFDADGEDLVLKVSDTQNEFPIPFEERSHGFQWFFSFYLTFLVESRNAHKGAILLLDEPGLHLHPTLQAKLIALFERISESNQVIYSTHLPFLIDGDHLERVRTIFLSDTEPQKTVVSNDLRPMGDKDTLFPLQAALGYSIAQTLFLGKRSVIVEGITDYWIIKALSSCLSANDGKPATHEDTVLIPAGGTSRLMPLASIMLSSTGVGGGRLLVLLDSDREGREATKRFEDAFQGASGVISLGDVVGVPEGTVEDLVPRDDYISILRKLGHQIDLNDSENAAPTNVKALEMYFQRTKGTKFGVAEKAAAALALIDNWAKDRTAISELTKKRASKLFAAINSHFDA